ncbi:MAG: ORF6N domain-containing protein [Sphingobacteriales bacterium]|nr:ORF6N domain-containing protein [Sphingobacteriales bacterium]
MLDNDLAELYDVETKRLKEAVRRNIERFPNDFMFELSQEEFNSLRTQNATLENGRGKHSKYRPFAFTEQGVAMLSSVLNTPNAIQMNIQIIRAFLLLRNFAITNVELTQKLIELELKYNKQFKDVYEALNYLISKDKQEIEQKERKRIGYK